MLNNNNHEKFVSLTEDLQSVIAHNMKFHLPIIHEHPPTHVKLIELDPCLSLCKHTTAAQKFN